MQHTGRVYILSLALQQPPLCSRQLEMGPCRQHLSVTKRIGNICPCLHLTLVKHIGVHPSLFLLGLLVAHVSNALGGVTDGPDGSGNRRLDGPGHCRGGVTSALRRGGGGMAGTAHRTWGVEECGRAWIRRVTVRQGRRAGTRTAREGRRFEGRHGEGSAWGSKDRHVGPGGEA